MKNLLKLLLWLASIFFLLGAVLCVYGWIRSDIDPVSWTADENPGFTGIFKPNNRLGKIQFLAKGAGQGPEDTAFGKDGYLYTGLNDGRVVKINPATGAHSEFANTGGRPLGMKFDGQNNLIVADGIKGLLRIDSLGAITRLVGPDQLTFADDLDIAVDGTIWFSDASSKHSFDATLKSFMEGERSGRLLSYKPSTGVLTTHMQGLFFANGVTLGPNEEFVLISETGLGRIHRLWLKGASSGTREIFADQLPGLTDNINFNGSDTVWVALPGYRNDILADKPLLRKILGGLPESLWRPTHRFGFVLGFDLNGKVTHNLQFKNAVGTVKYSDISSVQEVDGKLYLGSLVEDSIGVLELQP